MATNEVIGTVDRVFTNRGAWCAGVLKLAQSSGYAGEVSVKFAGACSVAEGDEVIMRGAWSIDPKWGRQFSVESAVHVGDTDLSSEDQGKKALVSFLKSNADFKHVGEKRAIALVDMFGSLEELGDALIHRPEEVVNKIPGLTRERVEALASMWAVSHFALKYQFELTQFGLSPKQARAAVAVFGSRTVEMLEQNPWLLYLEVPELGWEKVDTAALAKGFGSDHPYRLHARSVHACRQAAREGHTWISGEPVLLQRLQAVERELPRRYLDVIDRGPEESPRYVQALHELAEAEELIGDFLDNFSESPPALLRLAEASITTSNKLTPEQREAYEAAKRHRALFITGGAGTGKTYTAEAIVEAYEAAGGSVILAAPTGKAAKRLTESTGRPAYTIHRMLLSPTELEDFHRADLLLLDEVSMADSALLGWVLRELSPHTSVILMGDPNQLPPVQAGNPLRDALRLEASQVVTLSQVHRCAGDLKDCCVRVLDGEISEDVPSIWEVETVSGSQAATKELLGTLDALELLGHSYPDDIQVLSPMKKGPTGTFALNQLLRRRRFGEDAPDAFVEGDRVIQTKNDYKLDVFNGEVGHVIRAYPEDPSRLIIDMDGKVIEYRPYVDRTGTTIYPTNNLQWAYALTVHKVQGSEYPVVVLLLDNYHMRMLHRNLLYTAVTRAREAVYIIGTRSALATAAKTVVKDQRRTLLS